MLYKIHPNQRYRILWYCFQLPYKPAVQLIDYKLDNLPDNLRINVLLLPFI